MSKEAWIFVSLCTYVMCIALAEADCPHIAYPKHAQKMIYTKASVPVKKGLEHLVGRYPTDTQVWMNCKGQITTHKRTCLETGNWKGDEFHCEEDIKVISRWCPPSPGPLIGVKVRKIKGCENGCNPNSAISYTCLSRGMYLVGNAKIECGYSGQWSSSPPKCERKPKYSCPDPGQVVNATRVEMRKYDTPGFGPRDNVTFRCNPGYRFPTKNVFAVSMKCKPRFGGWDKKKPVCEAVTCLSPRAPRLGFVDPENRTLFEYGEMVTYSCRDGYDLKGQTRSMCRQSGQSGLWSGRLPLCLVIQCPDPGRPNHGRRSGQSPFLPGHTVEFSCLAGYTLLGSAERTCLESSTWNGTLTICDTGNTYCSDPGIPIAGGRTGNTFELGSTVQFKCRKGFYKRGSSERECLITREWSGKETFCQSSRSYDDPDEASTRFKFKLDALVEHTDVCEEFPKWDNYTAGDNDTEWSNYTEGGNDTEWRNFTEAGNDTKQKKVTVHPRCNRTLGRAIDWLHAGGLDLFLLFDVSSSITKADFKLAVDFAVSLVDKVRVSKKIGGTRVGVSSFGATLKVHSRIFRPEAADADKVKKSLREMKLLGGGTATSIALNDILRVQIPNSREFVRRGAKFALMLITDGDYNTGGDPIQIADKLKEDHKVDMYAIGVGKNYNKEHLAKLASDETQVWNLKDASVFTDIINGIVGVDVDYEECGVRNGREMSGNSTEIGQGWSIRSPETWPWMVGLYKSEKGEYHHICGGTLIGHRWVLSAAHCLKKRERNDNLEQQYVIRYGHAATNATDFYQEHILGIFTHPNYTFGHLDYDNDLVLLKLANHVPFGARMRAVCLPDDFEGDAGRNWYTDGWREHFVLGWGSREKLKDREIGTKETFLKTVGVKVTKNQTCLDSFVGANEKFKPVFNNATMFCGGDGHGRDSCKGDSGGPFLSVVKNNETNIKRVYQIGIVSWSIPGCRLDGQYGVYTRLANYLPWIRNTIQENDK